MYSNDNALDECIAENEYYETQNQRFQTYKTLLLITSFIVGILIISNTRRKYKKFREKYNLYEPEIDYEYFREIPSDLDPIFASELVFMKDPFNENKEKQEEYAAILLSLVRKQYVKISKLDDGIKEFSSDDYYSDFELIDKFIPFDSRKDETYFYKKIGGGGGLTSRSFRGVCITSEQTDYEKFV